jgi:hypothetical protein
MTQNLTNVCTMLHVAGFEAFVNADEISIFTNCSTPDFTFPDGSIEKTGLRVVPSVYPGTQIVEPGWYNMVPQ